MFVVELASGGLCWLFFFRRSLDAELIQQKLEAELRGCTVVLVRGGTEFEAAIAEPFDLILCDYHLLRNRSDGEGSSGARR